MVVCILITDLDYGFTVSVIEFLVVTIHDRTVEHTASRIGRPVVEPAFYFALGIVAEGVDFGLAVQFHPEVPEEFIVIVKLGCAPELGTGCYGRG